MIANDKKKEIKDLVELVYSPTATKEQITARSSALLSDEESREFFLGTLQDKLNISSPSKYPITKQVATNLSYFVNDTFEPDNNDIAVIKFAYYVYNIPGVSTIAPYNKELSSSLCKYSNQVRDSADLPLKDIIKLHKEWIVQCAENELQKDPEARFRKYQAEAIDIIAKFRSKIAKTDNLYQLQELTQKFFDDMLDSYHNSPSMILGSNSSGWSGWSSGWKDKCIKSSFDDGIYDIQKLQTILNDIYNIHSKFRCNKKDAEFLKETMKLVDEKIKNMPSTVQRRGFSPIEDSKGIIILCGIYLGIFAASLKFQKPIDSQYKILASIRAYLHSPKFYIPLAVMSVMCLLVVPISLMLSKQEAEQKKHLMKSRAKKLADVFDGALSK